MISSLILQKLLPRYCIILTKYSINDILHDVKNIEPVHPFVLPSSSELVLERQLAHEFKRPSNQIIWDEVIEIGRIIINSPNSWSHINLFGDPKNRSIDDPKSQVVHLDSPHGPLPYFDGEVTLSPDVRVRHLTTIKYIRYTPGAGDYPSFKRFDAHVGASVNGLVTLMVNPEAHPEALEFEEPDKDIAITFADDSPFNISIPFDTYLYMPNAFNRVEVAGPLDALGPKTIAFLQRFTTEALDSFRALAPALPSTIQEGLAKQPTRELET